MEVPSCEEGGRAIHSVMAGLVPAIHVLPHTQKDVDARLRGAFAGMTKTLRHGRARPGHPRLAAHAEGRGCPPSRRLRGHDELRSQARGQITPLRIHLVNEPDLPRPRPVLDRLLALNGVADIVEALVVDQQLEPISFREPVNQSLSMLVGTRKQIARHTDVKDPVAPVGHEVDEAAPLHAAEHKDVDGRDKPGHDGSQSAHSSSCPAKAGHPRLPARTARRGWPGQARTSRSMTGSPLVMPGEGRASTSSCERGKTWMAGTSPAMTALNRLTPRHARRRPGIHVCL